jgi:hypothetical protein
MMHNFVQKSSPPKMHNEFRFLFHAASRNIYTRQKKIVSLTTVSQNILYFFLYARSYTKFVGKEHEFTILNLFAQKNVYSTEKIPNKFYCNQANIKIFALVIYFKSLKIFKRHLIPNDIPAFNHSK